MSYRKVSLCLLTILATLHVVQMQDDCGEIPCHPPPLPVCDPIRPCGPNEELLCCGPCNEKSCFAYRPKPCPKCVTDCYCKENYLRLFPRGPCIKLDYCRRVVANIFAKRL